VKRAAVGWRERSRSSLCDGRDADALPENDPEGQVGDLNGVFRRNAHAQSAAWRRRCDVRPSTSGILAITIIIFIGLGLIYLASAYAPSHSPRSTLRMRVAALRFGNSLVRTRLDHF